MAIMATSEAQTVTEARVATEISEAQMVMETMVVAALEVQTVTEAQVATETSEDHRVTEVRAETTLEGHRVTEVLVETISEPRREDLREPLQTADAETGPTTKVVPTLV